MHHDEADAIRAVGLFDLHDHLAGLLKAVAAFLEQHRISAPVSYAHRHSESRGWQADLELRPADFQRVLRDYPMPVTIEPHPGQPGALWLRTELRAGTLSASLPLPSAGLMRAEGLVISLR
jgi:hypothetical protein